MKEKQEGLDFAPDLTVPSENISRKTSVNFNEEVAAYLDKKRTEGSINVSAYINKVITERYEVEKALTADIYGTMPKNLVKVELILHKDLAAFLKLLELQNGAIPLANKIAELLQLDTSGIMNGDCNVYGSRNTLDNALAAYVRAIKRLKDGEL